MKLSFSLATLATLAAAALAGSSQCSEMWAGQLQYSYNFAAGADHNGWVQYSDGALTVDYDAKHGVDVKLQRCGEREFQHCRDCDPSVRKGVVGRVVFPDDKCLLKDGDAISVGDCSKHAEFIQPGDPDGKTVTLDTWDSRGYTQWFAADDGSLGYREDPHDGLESVLNIVGY